jgi:hypothetical protein
MREREHRIGGTADPSVGIAIGEIGSDGTSPSSITLWFSEAVMSRARSTSRRTSSRQAASSKARTPPASIGSYPTRYSITDP